MKNLLLNITALAVTSGILLLTSCQKDALQEIKDIAPVIYLTRAESGSLLIKPENSKINQADQTISFAMGVHRSGLADSEGFSVAITASHANIPSSAVPLATDLVSASTVTVPAGQTTGIFYVTIPKATLDAHPGKTLAIAISLSNPTNYPLNAARSTVNVLVNVDDFGDKQVEVTSTYLKNAGGGDGTFLRADNNGLRFGDLKDWTVNTAGKNKYGGTFGGFDSYNGKGYLSMEYWDETDLPIANGKIFQTMRLPAGSYVVEYALESSGYWQPAYITAAEGTSLPDVADIATALASTDLKNDRIHFTLEQEKQISMGIVADFASRYQGFRVTGVKLYKIESLF